MAEIHPAPILVNCNRSWTISRTSPNPAASEIVTSIWLTRGSKRLDLLVRRNREQRAENSRHAVWWVNDKVLYPNKLGKETPPAILRTPSMMSTSSHVVASVVKSDSCAVSSREGEKGDT